MRRPEFIARQSACPSGLLGRLIGRVMAAETASANRSALELLDVRAGDHVLEVGFGPGVTIARLSDQASAGRVAGVDLSAEMLRMAACRNQAAIRLGRVELQQGRAEALPYPDGSFHKVVSVHTLYFWPEPRRTLAEMRRVLKAEGRLVLGWRADPDAARQFPESTYRFHDEDAVQAMLTTAGFVNIEFSREQQARATLHFAVARYS